MKDISRDHSNEKLCSFFDVIFGVLVDVLRVTLIAGDHRFMNHRGGPKDKDLP